MGLMWVLAILMALSAAGSIVRLRKLRDTIKMILIARRVRRIRMSAKVRRMRLTAGRRGVRLTARGRRVSLTSRINALLVLDLHLLVVGGVR